MPNLEISYFLIRRIWGSVDNPTGESAEPFLTLWKIGSGVKTPEPPVTRIVSCFALPQSCFNSDSRGAFAPLHPH